MSKKILTLASFMLCVFTTLNASAQTSSSDISPQVATTSNTEKQKTRFENKMEKRMERAPNKMNKNGEEVVSTSNGMLSKEERQKRREAKAVGNEISKTEEMKPQDRMENTSFTKPAQNFQNKESNEGEEKIKSNPSCRNIIEQCKQMGFVVGGFKEGNGLWKNCFFPTISGQGATQKGKAVSVAVNASDVASCKAFVPQERIEKAQKNGEEKLTSAANNSLNKEERQKRKEARAAIENAASSAEESSNSMKPQERRHNKKMAVQSTESSTQN